MARNAVGAYHFSTQPETKVSMAMKQFVIERNIPRVHCMGPDELKGAAAASNAALAELAPKVKWLHSYVTADKTFCIYMAEDEAAVRKHAELSGFPANVISEVTTIIDPNTANA